jgi:hypothetical protein
MSSTTRNAAELTDGETATRTLCFGIVTVGATFGFNLGTVLGIALLAACAYFLLFGLDRPTSPPDPRK